MIVRDRKPTQKALYTKEKHLMHISIRKRDDLGRGETIGNPSYLNCAVVALLYPFFLSKFYNHILIHTVQWLTAGKPFTKMYAALPT